jgi:hypothetical protein
MTISAERLVKPLEWSELTSPREDGPAEPTGDIEAITLIGEFSVCFDDDEAVASTPWCCWGPHANIGHFADFDEAKAAAQADYAASIISALDPSMASELLALRERERVLVEALTPSGDTKAAYIGEFSFTVTALEIDESGEPVECQRSVTVPWTTVKEIMAAILARADDASPTNGEKE